MLIRCDNIKVQYNDQTVIDNLSFSVDEGDYLCIVGDNGAGKSTLLKCILGLKNISAGTLAFAEGFAQGSIGYVPQTNDAEMNFPATVREIVLSGSIGGHGASPFYSKAEKALAVKYIEEVGLSKEADRSFNDLSGGMKRRVMLARALMASSRLLVMDEPVSSLDPIATREFYEKVNAIHDEGMTIIMVSHDIHTAVHNATHILHLSNRLPNFFGTKEEYLKSDIGHTYLGKNGDCAQCHQHFEQLKF